MNDYFSKYHPLVNFTYFVFVIGFSMFFLHPIYMSISISGGFIYLIILNGKKGFKFNVFFMLPMLLIVGCINPLFNHEGETILFYLKNGNPFTLESVVYGLVSGVMLVTIIIWFSCYNKIMTSDKFIYLFGKIIPSLSLILSMVLRFVPEYKAKIITISNAQKCIGKDVSNGNIIQKAKNGIKILSIMITWSLENGIETADSMKARGYGLKGRTSFSNYKMNSRDKINLVLIIILAIFILFCATFDITTVRYFPTIRFTGFGMLNILSYITYFILFFMPVIITIKEEIRWKYLISKI